MLKYFSILFPPDKPSFILLSTLLQTHGIFSTENKDFLETVPSTLIKFQLLVFVKGIVWNSLDTVSLWND